MDEIRYSDFEKEYFENLDINSVVGTFAKMKNKRKQSVSVVHGIF